MLISFFFLYHRVHELFFCQNYFIHVFWCFRLNLSFGTKLVGNGLYSDDCLPIKTKNFSKMENLYSLQAIKFA